jgi:hypothetical protein
VGGRTLKWLKGKQHHYRVKELSWTEDMSYPWKSVLFPSATFFLELVTPSSAWPLSLTRPWRSGKIGATTWDI